MRVGLVSTVGTPVGPSHAGSIESLVWLLARELEALGHMTTVFAAAGSAAPGTLVETLPGTYGRDGAPADWQLCEWLNLCRAVERSGEFDVLHSHCYLMGLPLARLAGCPLVHTTHVQPYDADAALWRLLPDSAVSAISHAQWAGFPDLSPAAVIPHGLDPGAHRFSATPGDHLLFLGRFSPGKGPLHAVAAARSLDMPIVLAGPESDYFREHVAPLVDGERVRYAGSVTGAERDRLYGSARVLAFPVQAPEPFGLVMVEAMMSGTPVAAYRVGAVPEIVEDGTTGALVDPGGAFTDAVERALRLDRRVVGEVARERFAAARMGADYAQLYESIAR